MGKGQGVPGFGLPRPGEGKRGEEGYVGYLLRQAAGAYRNRCERDLKDLGITTAQFTVMTMIAAYPGHSGADLARIALLTPQTVSVIIANLEKSGLVSRSPHAVHGRIQQLDLTDAGRDRLAAARKKIHALDGALRHSLSKEDEQVVRRWLVAVAIDHGEGAN